MIIAGKIKIKHGAVVKFEKEGACIDDGTLLPADLIIMATGVYLDKTLYHATKISCRVWLDERRRKEYLWE